MSRAFRTDLVRIGASALRASVRVVAVRIAADQTVLVAPGKDGFYGTSDLGETWKRMTGAEWTLLWHFPNVIVAPSDPSTRYTEDPVGIIKRSQDSGKTWVQPQPIIEGVSAAEMAFRVSGEHDYVLEFDFASVHPLKPLTIYATGTVGPPRRPGGDFREQYVLKGMYVSDDGGENWRQFSDRVGIFNKYPRRVVLGASPANADVMFSEGEHGILRSTDGGQTWMPVGESELLNREPLDVNDKAEGVTTGGRMPC